MYVIMKRFQPSSLWIKPLIKLLLVISMVERAATVEERDIYLVVLEGEPVAFHPGVAHQIDSELAKSHATSLIKAHNEFLQNTLEVGAYNKLYSFHHIANGFAVHTTQSQAERLRAASGVLHVEKDRRAKLMTTYTPHVLGLPERVWSQANGEEHAGEGIVIGVIDTGINPSHPSFAYDPSKKFDQFSGEACEVGPMFAEESCNGKILSARYFAAGAAALIPLDASKDLSPFDEEGHGSHVASIAAGNWDVPVVVNGFEYGRASGMAPRARIRIYKALYPGGGTIADVISAIDQAAQDKVDVIVLSIGPDEPPAGTITFMNIFDMFLLFARKAGIFVAQAAGNKGPEESTVVSFCPWAIGVGSSTTSRSYNATLMMGDGRQIQGMGLSAPTFGDGLIQYKLVSAKDAATTVNGSTLTSTLYAEECQHPQALQPAMVQASIVICSFSQGFFNGTSTVMAILETARVLGFAGFILVANSKYGDFIAEPLPFTVPAIMISQTALSEVLWDYYEKHTYRDARGMVLKYGGSSAILEGRVASFSETSPIVSRFSSRGPDIMDSRMSPADVLKPDILAPGHQIWAAWSPASTLDPILSGNNFALLSGTSMAAPHVAGVAALIKQLHPLWTPSMIASAISTTASKYDDHGLPIMSQGAELYSLYPSTPFDYGAGFINPSSALDPGLVFSSEFEDYVSFLCSLPGIDPSTVRQTTGRACNLSLSSPADLNLPSITVSALRSIQHVRRQAVNVAGKPETYLCSVLPPEGVDVDVQPSYFTIESEGTQDLVIKLNASRVLESFSFGEITLTGSLNHIVRLPLSVRPMSV